MTIVELNGFDESGNIGENLRFTRVGVDVHEELRPLIYNLLHFGSLIMTKDMVRGESPEDKKAYVRSIMDDPAIQIDHYAYPPAHQLKLLRYYCVSELAGIFTLRGELLGMLEDLEKPESKDHMSRIIGRLRVYNKPYKQVETFIKAYAYRMVIEDLKNTSTTLGDISTTDYRVFSFVDGGFPFVFWGEAFLRRMENLGERFSTRLTPILGISHGDEYYPLPAMAGHVSGILNTYPEMIYPQNVKELPVPTEDIFRSFYAEYKEGRQSPRFLKRMFFIGHIEPNLQFTIPFIQCKLDNNRIYEPFRIMYSFKDFFKEYGGRRPTDVVVQGNLRDDIIGDAEKSEECETYGLDVKPASEYVQHFESLVGDVHEKARESNLSDKHISRVEKKLETSVSIVRRVHS